MAMHLRTLLSYVLLIGTLLSIILVAMGGIYYLKENGQHTLSASFYADYPTVIQSPFIMIKLGLFVLIGTQFLRVALLAFSYIINQDKWFSAFSLFILITLFYSFLQT